MRSNADIDKIKSTFSPPEVIKEFLTIDQLDRLLEIYETSENKVQKNTGPITLDLSSCIEDELILYILEKIKNFIGEYKIISGFYFETSYPHVIHNDDSFELPDTVYKGITIPIKCYGDEISDNPDLCFFDQHYFHGPSKFFNRDADITFHYNTPVYDYDLVENLSSEKISREIYSKYFTHLKYQWLEGLSLQTVKPWRPGTAIIFDSLQLHCASDFRKNNVNKKLGISIFTKKC